jgi:four helix bundle protein
MNGYDILQRAKLFKSNVDKLVESLPDTESARTIGEQLSRSVKLVEDNYRAAHRSHSSKEFVSKAGISLEETDTCLRWIELFKDEDIVPMEQITELIRQGDELIAIFSEAITNARAHPRT